MWAVGDCNRSIISPSPSFCPFRLSGGLQLVYHSHVPRIQSKPILAEALFARAPSSRNSLCPKPFFFLSA